MPLQSVIMLGFCFRLPSYFQWLKQDRSSNHCSEVIFKYRIGNKEKHRWKIHSAQHQSNYKSRSQRQQTWKGKIYLKCYCWIDINQHIIVNIISVNFGKAFESHAKNTVNLFSVSESQRKYWCVLLWCHFFPLAIREIAPQLSVTLQKCAKSATIFWKALSISFCPGWTQKIGASGGYRRG